MTQFSKYIITKDKRKILIYYSDRKFRNHYSHSNVNCTKFIFEKNITSLTKRGIEIAALGRLSIDIHSNTNPV